jgi:tRNA threonylcarbamoyladenosine biosynthesis protein TsaE
MEYKTHSLQEFMTEAVRLARTLEPNGTAATVIALSGDLGAGKTTFVQAIAREFGVVDQVNSPTFVIEKIYACEQGPFQRLIHMDAYRLKDVHELEALGWHELIADKTNLVLVEWPENIIGAIPDRAIRVLLSGEGDERTIIYGKI